MDLHLLWFGILGVLLTGYAILDGFDLGVGMLHPLARTDQERRIFMNSIGPLWDGNEVWLVTFGGALFAAFPNAYATAFSALLPPLHAAAVRPDLPGGVDGVPEQAGHPGMAALLGRVLLRGQRPGHLPLRGGGGDSMTGLPIGADMEFHGGLRDLVRPYSVLVGGLAVATFLMHGSIYLYLKTEGDLQQRVHGWMWRTFGIFLVAYLLTTIVTLVTLPHAHRNFGRHPWMWGVVVLNVLAVANIPRAIHQGRPLYAFLSSASTIAALIFLFGVALFPNLIVSSLDPA